MRKSKKQLLRTLMACGLVVSVAAGGTVAYLTDAETATNTFTVGKVKIDLEEPGYPGNDSDEVKNIIPNQEIVKDPQIENTGNNDALVFLRVEVPQEEFTELDTDNNVGEKKLQDLFKLKGVSDQWELLRTETTTDADGKTKTSYVYGYKKTLAKGTTTDKLFQKVQMKNSIEKELEGNVEDIIITACAIQATDIPDVNLTPAEDGTIGKDVLDQVYTIFMNQSEQGDSTSKNDDKIKTTATLLNGETLNAHMKILAGDDSSPDDETYDTSITAIQRSTKQPSAAVIADANSLISTSDSEVPVYAWFENGTIKWWSEANKIEASSDLSHLCSNLARLSNIDGLSYWDISNVINMQETFVYCYYLQNTTSLSNWDTRNVTDMSGMFYECTKLADITGLSNWNTGNVTYMGSMFENAQNLTDITPLGNWDTRNVTDMSYAFLNCTCLTDVSGINNWDLSSVADFSSMFKNCPSHPEFTNRTGTWSNGTFTPAA